MLPDFLSGKETNYEETHFLPDEDVAGVHGSYICRAGRRMADDKVLLEGLLPESEIDGLG